MKVHEIYPKKVRVEGCGQEAIYVDACDGYGADVYLDPEPYLGTFRYRVRLVPLHGPAPAPSPPILSCGDAPPEYTERGISGSATIRDGCDRCVLVR